MLVNIKLQTLFKTIKLTLPSCDAMVILCTKITEKGPDNKSAQPRRRRKKEVLFQISVLLAAMRLLFKFLCKMPQLRDLNPLLC